MEDEKPVDPLHWLGRTQLIVGRKNLELLQSKHVIVLGMGGVGSFAAELIARGGVGEMTIVDGDVVDPTNRNRQLPALSSTHGQSKADLMAARLLDINPNLKLHVVKEFLTPPKVVEILSKDYDYVVDAIDSISPKIRVLVTAYRRRLRLISSMGAGGKLDPTQVRMVDISDTYNCRLAQQVRKILKKNNIRWGFKAIFSPELPRREWLMYTDGSNYKKSAYGTMSYMPAVFGCCCASAVIRGLIDMEEVKTKGTK